MNGLDLVLVVGAVLAGLGGWQLGLIARTFAWVGLVVGAGAAYLAIPVVLAGAGIEPSARGLVLLTMVGVMVSGLVGQLVGSLVGARLRPILGPGAGATIDRVLGAGAGVAAVVALAWVLTPILAEVPGEPAELARGSALVEVMERALPPAPDASRYLDDLLGDEFPQVFSGVDPTGAVADPPPSSGLSVAEADRLARSTVKVIGEACGSISVGSGFVIASDLVATNAHVVAGHSATEVETSDGDRRSATVVAFDPVADVAIVAAPGLDRPALPLRPAVLGERGAAFGYPGGQPLRLAPFEVVQDLTAVGRDIYDRRSAQREVLVVAAALERGDSGSALVAADGTVVAMAFAIATDRPGVAYALTVREIEAVLADVSGAAVATGPCAA